MPCHIGGRRDRGSQLVRTFHGPPPPLRVAQNIEYIVATVREAVKTWCTWTKNRTRHACWSAL
eukprot:2731933-Prymnesium_polylepis.1